MNSFISRRPLSSRWGFVWFALACLAAIDQSQAATVGKVVAYGNNSYGQAVVPVGLSDVVAGLLNRY